MGIQLSSLNFTSTKIVTVNDLNEKLRPHRLSPCFNDGKSGAGTFFVKARIHHLFEEVSGVFSHFYFDEDCTIPSWGVGGTRCRAIK